MRGFLQVSLTENITTREAALHHLIKPQIATPDRRRVQERAECVRTTAEPRPRAEPGLVEADITVLLE